MSRIIQTQRRACGKPKAEGTTKDTKYTKESSVHLSCFSCLSCISWSPIRPYICDRLPVEPPRKPHGDEICDRNRTQPAAGGAPAVRERRVRRADCCPVARLPRPPR